MLHYEIEVRDSEGKPYVNSKGQKVLNAFRFKEIDMAETIVELICKDLFNNYTAISKEGSQINISVSYHNKISDTHPVLYSYYGSEKRFVKH